MKKQKFYMAKEWGHCGPCAFINLIGLRGSLKLERELIVAGRAKPFFNSDWFSFLIWARKYGINLEVYLTTRKFHGERYKKLGRYEKCSSEQMKAYKAAAEKRYSEFLKRFKSQISLVKNPLKKLDFLLKHHYCVAILVSNNYAKPKFLLPHFIVAFKKKGNQYLFMDSSYGLIKLSGKEILKSWALNKQLGCFPKLIAYNPLNN